jgi:3-isopropylmalate dehydrogenase
MKKDQYRIAVLPGDGIGPEVMTQAVNVLQAVARKARFAIDYQYADVGGVAIEKFANPLPAATLEICKRADAVLLAAIGDPKYDQLPSDQRPEKGLLGLRGSLGLFANLRPAKIYPSLVSASTLRPDVVQDIDILIIRELTGGLYFGEPRGLDDEKGYNTMVYHRHEVERITRVAFEAARKRRKKVTSVDKANVLEVSQFWRRIVLEIAKEYPDVTLDHIYVDNCAMQLVRNPKQFDVLLTENMFGDILSDEAAMLTGSLGMLPSASLGTGTAMYEPVHGSAPDIAGRNVANPIATIASVAMLLRYSFDRQAEAEAVENAIARVLQKGHRTRDIATAGDAVVSTTEMGDLVIKALD